MKDIVITSQMIRRERNIYLLCFLLSFAINMVAIVVYERPWIEVLSQLGYVFVISIFFYIILWIPRLIFKWICRLFRNKG